jgi:hypothetical protein
VWIEEDTRAGWGGGGGGGFKPANQSEVDVFIGKLRRISREGNVPDWSVAGDCLSETMNGKEKARARREILYINKYKEKIAEYKEKNMYTNNLFYDLSHPPLLRSTKTNQNLQLNLLVIYFSSICIDHRVVHVRGCERDFLHLGCKEIFSGI